MENKFELIEKYLMNEMSLREQKEFEELLAINPELMSEFVLRKDINKAIVEDDIIGLRAKLNQIIYPETLVKKPKKHFYFYSAVAAVVILFVVSSVIFLHAPSQIEKKEVFKTYYSVYPDVISSRSAKTQNEMEKLSQQAFRYYEHEQYDSAAIYFKRVLVEDETNSMSQFYLSMCKIETNHFIEAKEALENLALKQNHLFWEQSNWYLALLYIKLDETKNAEHILKKMVCEDMTRKNEAEIILKFLN